MARVGRKKETHVITIPTSELTGCITDALCVFTTPPKNNPLSGVAIEWDGESLHFTAYDIYSGATVEWTPGNGDEQREGEDDAELDVDWGGTDDPWRVFVAYDDAKEIIKLFRLPAKLWRTPVTLKVNAIGTKLTVERDDSRRGERLLLVPTDNNQLRNVPPVREWADKTATNPADISAVAFSPARLGAFGVVRAHGNAVLRFGGEGHPVGIRIGSRFAGFLFEARATVHRYNVLRDGSGVQA